MLTIGCVASQKVSGVSAITGQWEISGIERDGKYIESKYDDKVIFIFTENSFDVVCENKSLFDVMDWPSCSYHLQSGKVVLKNSSGEKISADIEFFNPNSFRISNWKATEQAMLMIMSLRAAFIGKLDRRDKAEAYILDTTNKYIYFSRT
jgi:hypothetical protein